MSARFLDALHSGRVLLMDGAMGTELMRAGLPEGECGERWNLTHPEQVRKIHQAYADAGAVCFLTNTFQANPPALARHGLNVDEVFESAAELARSVAGKERFVLADVGPIAVPAEAESVARAVWAVEDRIDGVLVETLTGPECLPAIRELRSRLAGLPFLVSLTFRRLDEENVTTLDGTD